MDPKLWFPFTFPPFRPSPDIAKSRPVSVLARPRWSWAFCSVSLYSENWKNCTAPDSDEDLHFKHLRTFLYWTSYTFLKERLEACKWSYRCTDPCQGCMKWSSIINIYIYIKIYIYGDIYIYIYNHIYTYSTYINIETTKHQPWEGRLDWLASQLQQRTCWEASSQV